MAKILFVLAIVVTTTISFADGLCVQLCVDCSLNPENETCTKVDQVCGNCPFILDSLKQDSLASIARADSIEQEKVRKDSLQNIDIRKLADIMQNNCKSDTCIFEVTVDNGQLGHIRAKKGNKTTAKTQPEQTPQESLLPPISKECKNFCSLCSSENQGESSSTCEKIEEQCKCLAYAEQEQMLVQKAEEDSINAVKKFLNQMQNAQTSARSILDFCERKAQANVCSVMVKVKGDLMSITEFKDLTVPPVPQSAITKDTIEVVNTPVKDTTKKDSSKFKTHPNPYKGISFAFERYLEKQVGNYDVKPQKQWGLNLGFFKRWYFYQWGSFQTGINAVYHQAEYEFEHEEMNDYYDPYYYNFPYRSSYDSKIDYINVMLEVPLQVRLGFPLGKAKKISPFVSASFHIRKPIYIWMDYDIIVDSYHHKEGSYSDSYGVSDWEFLTFVGLGIEISRAISFQWQFLPVSIVTNTSAITNYYCDDSDGMTWRFSMDASW